MKQSEPDITIWKLQLRHHPPPRQEHFDTLKKCASAKGFKINTKTNKDLANSLDMCIDVDDPVVNKVKY